MAVFIVAPIWLYFWVTGWKLARYVGFLAFFFALVVINDHHIPAAGNLPMAIVVLSASAALAWLGSGLPIYVRNIMARREADNAVDSGSGRVLSFY